MKILTKVMDLLALSVILSFMILMFSGCQMASPDGFRYSFRKGNYCV